MADPIDAEVARRKAAQLLDSAREATVLRPGDTVLIRLDPATSAEYFAEATQTLNGLAPDIKWVIVSAVQVEVVRAAADG